MKGLFFTLCKIAFGLAILSIVSICVLYPKLPGLAATALSKRFGVPVLIQEISVSPKAINIKNFTITNLPNRILRTALCVHTVSCEAPLTNYLHQEVVVEEILVNNIYLGLEFNSASSTDGNWTELMNNYSTTATPSKENKKSKEVLIKKLVLRNIHVEIAYIGKEGTRKLKPIEEIVLYNINSNEGLPADQIMRSALGQMLKSVFVQENLSNMLDGILNQPKNAGDTLLNPLKNLFR